MKILERQDVSNWSYVWQCKKCDSKLEADSEDIKFTRCDGDFRDPGYDSFSVICPVCSESLILVTNILPKILQIEIKNRSTRSNSNSSYYDR